MLGDKGFSLREHLVRHVPVHKAEAVVAIYIAVFGRAKLLNRVQRFLTVNAELPSKGGQVFFRIGRELARLHFQDSVGANKPVVDATPKAKADFAVEFVGKVSSPYIDLRGQHSLQLRFSASPTWVDTPT